MTDTWKLVISITLLLAVFLAAHIVFLLSGNFDCGNFELVRRNASRRDVLMLGDSISKGILRHLDVPENTRVVHPCNGMTGGCANSDRAMHCAAQWVGNRSWDTIVFNFGMHDISETTEHVALSRYVDNMRRVAALLRRHTADLVWVTTTPVPNKHSRPRRTQCDVLRYNDAMAKLVHEVNVTTVDMFSFMNTRCAAGLFYDSCALQIPGDVHFTPQGYEQMADVLGAQLFTR